MKRLISNLSLGLLLTAGWGFVKITPARPKVVIGLRGAPAKNRNNAQEYQNLYILPGPDDVGSIIQMSLITTMNNIVQVAPVEGEIIKSGREGTQFIVKENTAYYLPIDWNKVSSVIILSDRGTVILREQPITNYLDLDGNFLKAFQYKKLLKRNKMKEIKLRSLSDWRDGQ